MSSTDNKNPVYDCSNDRNEKRNLTSTNLVDPASMAILNHAGDLNNCKCPEKSHDDDNYVRRLSRSTSSRNSRSQDTAIIATDVGSVVRPKKNPFMMSLTFFDPKVYYKRLACGKSPVAKTEANICLDPVNEDVDILVCEDVTFYNPNTYYELLEQEKNGTEFDVGTSTDIEAGVTDVADESNDDEIPGGDCGVHNKYNAQDDNDSDVNAVFEDDISFEVNDLRHWDLILRDPIDTQQQQHRKKSTFYEIRDKIFIKNNNKPSLVIDDFDGLIKYSCFEHGDKLISVNNKIIDPIKFCAASAVEYMHHILHETGVLHIVAENPSGNDTDINVTIIRPRPNMGYRDLGLEVWNWPYLCVRAIKPDSIFQYTCINEGDEISAINDIDCTKLRDKEFAKCVDELPGIEITISLIRRKHRATMSFS
mmetsp:Transcript_26324/g.54955  ORF Transcript_26324/g.54955 Transcript_26324/m.54955 type:complete len:422 (-) Transcript_26324:269-1534(-)